jgi:hypothetical protein
MNEWFPKAGDAHTIGRASVTRCHDHTLNATTKPLIDRIPLIWRFPYIQWTTIQQWGSYYIGPIETSNYITEALFVAAIVQPLLDNDQVHNLLPEWITLTWWGGLVHQ